MGRFSDGASDSISGSIGVLDDERFIWGSSFLDWLIGGCCAMPAVRSSLLLIHSLGGASYIFSDGLIAGVSGDFGGVVWMGLGDIFPPVVVGVVVVGVAPVIVGVAVAEFAIGAGIVVIVARGIAS